MLRIGHAQYQELRRHGEETYPHESCGVLLGRLAGGERVVTSVVRCGNARVDAARDHYHIDPRELLRAQRLGREHGEDVMGFYHSHPDHPARWSPTDLAEAHWLGCSYVITSVGRGRAEATRSFALEGEGEDAKRFEEEELLVASVPTEAQPERAAPGDERLP
jgi:proteasome lid subunit RPN8/RPN11